MTDLKKNMIKKNKKTKKNKKKEILIVINK